MQSYPQIEEHSLDEVHYTYLIMMDYQFILSTILFFVGSLLLVRKSLEIACYFAFISLMYLNAQYVLQNSSFYFSEMFPDVGKVSIDNLNTYWLFVQLSLTSIFVFLWLALRIGKKSKNAAQQKSRFVPSWPLYFVLFSITYASVAWFAFFTITISYDAGTYPKYLSLIVLIGTPLLVVQYARARIGSNLKMNIIIYWILFFFSSAAFLAINLKGGTRSAMIAVLLAIIIYEMRLLETKPIRKRLASYLNISVIAIFSILMLNLINVLRQISPSATPLDYISALFSFGSIEALFAANYLFQTYSIPPILLLASIEHKFIDPWSVLVSNFFNAFVMLDSPYLSTIVSSISNPDLEFNRRAGYAYSILIEGYNFMGFLGFIYNGLVVGGGLFFWRMLLKTNDIDASRFASALFVVPLMSIIFGQSAIFLKMTYLIMLPGMLFYQLAFGRRNVWTSFHSIRFFRRLTS